jgi:hypothetical protein
MAEYYPAAGRSAPGELADGGRSRGAPGDRGARLRGPYDDRQYEERQGLVADQREDPPSEQLVVAGILEGATAEGRAAGGAPQVDGFARRGADPLVQAASTGVGTPHHDTRRVDRLTVHPW